MPTFAGQLLQLMLTFLGQVLQLMPTTSNQFLFNTPLLGPGTPINACLLLPQPNEPVSEARALGPAVTLRVTVDNLNITSIQNADLMIFFPAQPPQPAQPEPENQLFYLYPAAIRMSLPTVRRILYPRVYVTTFILRNIFT